MKTPTRFVPALIAAFGLLVLSVSPVRAAFITLTNGDASGNTNIVSFTSKGYWDSGAAPTNGNTYFIPNTNSVGGLCYMRTPTNNASFAFNGDSLTLSGPGNTTAAGGRAICGSTVSPTSLTYSFTNATTGLTLTNFGMLQDGGSGSAFTYVGGVLVTNGGVLLPAAQMIFPGSLAGNGPLWLGSPSAVSAGAVTFMGNIGNFTGSIFATNNGSTLIFSNSLTQTLAGNLTLSRTNAVTVQGPGTLTLVGNNSYGGRTIVSVGTLILTGNNPGATNSTYITNSATLQLQANGANTVASTSYALGTLATAANRLNGGSTLQLRSDSSVLFNGGDSLAGLGGATVTFDVNQLTGSGANNILSFATAGFNTASTVINVTGGNGYSLALGQLTGINGASPLTLVPSTAGLSVAGIAGSVNPLIKNGAGTLTLTAASSYTGSTIINTGVVALAASATLASTNILVNTNGTLDVTGQAGSSLALASGQVLLGNGIVKGGIDGASGAIYPGSNGAAGTLTITTNLTLSGGGSVNFDLANNTAIGGGTNDLIMVGGNLAITGPTAFNLKFLNGVPAPGTYTLIECGSISTDLSLATLPVNPRYFFTLTTNLAGTAVQLVIAGTPANLVWLGDGSANNWDNSGAYQNWLNGGAPDYFYDLDIVTFNDVGSNSPAINLVGTLDPSSVTVNSTNNYDFAGAGSISSLGTLTKNNTGTLILESVNNYGSTVINGGALQIGNGGAVGSLAGAISNNAALVVNETVAVTLASPISGSGSLTQAGSGSLTLSASNSYDGYTFINNGTVYLSNGSGLGSTAGGTTVATGGQLNINANVNVGAEALALGGTGPDGSGALRKGGGGTTTFGGSITLNTNTTIKLDGGATLNLTNTAGINSTSVNANLTLAGDGSSAGKITGPVALGTGGLVKDSVSAWTLTGINNSWTGGTTIAGGTLQIGDGGSNGSLGTGLITNNGAFIFYSSNNFVINDIISGTGSFKQNGAGKTTLTASNTFTGGTTVNGGTLVLTGTNSFGAGVVTVGNAASGNAVLNISVSANVTGNTNFVVGNAANANGAVNLSGGTLVLSPVTDNDLNFNLGAVASSYGYLNMSGGILSTKRFQVGGSGAAIPGTGVGVISGGTVTNTGYLIIGRQTNGIGSLTIASGGTLNHSAATANLALAYSGGRGELNLTGGTLDNSGRDVTIRQSTGPATGIVNLNSGTLSANSFVNNSGSAYLNFNGGTLKASLATNNFIPTTMTSVNIFSGGATIDDGGNPITIPVALVAPGGSGVTSIAMNTKGAAYIGAPYVSITGGTATTPATAIANMADDGTGNGTLKVDSITITCPGVYSVIPTDVTFVGGGGTGAAAGTINTAANSSGGLIKQGSSTLTLSGSNTYTSNTFVETGTLALTGTGSIASSANIIVAGAANLDVSAAGLNVGLAQTLSGAGTVLGTTAVAGTLAAQTNNIPATLTISGNLTLSGTTLVALHKSLSLSNSFVSVSGALTNTGTGTIVVTNFGPALVAGDSFQLFSQAVSNGAAMTITPAPGAGLAWQNNLAVNGTIAVVTGVASNPTNIFFSVSGSTLNLSWPADHLGWVLQSQTNSLSVGLNTNWVDVAGSQNVISTNININSQTPADFFRLRKP
jgi:autotransporter-associated beta strand protein